MSDVVGYFGVGVHANWAIVKLVLANIYFQAILSLLFSSYRISKVMAGAVGLALDEKEHCSKFCLENDKQASEKSSLGALTPRLQSKYIDVFQSHGQQ